MKLRVERSIYCLFIVFLFHGLAVKGQPYYFKQYQVQDGLSNNNVTSCLQDADGFMWFGTRDGLNRFDGYSFRVFRYDSDVAKSIGSNWIHSLALDKEGTLWVGTYMGLFRYNQMQENFDLIPFTGGMRVDQLCFDEQDDLWILLEESLVKYNTRLDSYKTYTIPDNSLLSAFCITPLGSLWIATFNGMLYQFNKEKGEFVGFDLFAHSTDIHIKQITKLYPTESGDKLFVGTFTHGVKLFDIHTGTYDDLFRYDNNRNEITIKDFLQVSSDEVWVASESGLFIYRMASNHYTHVEKRLYDPYSLSTNSLFSFCRDKDNGIWIGTYSGGVNHYSALQFFTKYDAYPEEESLSGELIHDICTDQYNNLWIATEDAGINKLDRKTGKYTHYQPQRGVKSLSHKNIHGLVADGDKLWVGSFASGIDLMDIPSGRILKHYNIGEGTFDRKSQVIVNMKKLRNGLLLVATAKGMFYYDTPTDQFALMPQFPTHYKIQSIFEDRKGVIWAGTVNKGVYFYNPTDHTSGQLLYDTLATNSSNTINDIYEDEQSDLWFATLDGLKRYEPTTQRTTSFTMKQGMPSDFALRILPDRSNNLWISTTNGLVCLNLTTYKIMVYSEEHGLPTNQFNYNSAWKENDGRIYFGLIRGMISFNPDEIRTDKQKAVVYLTDMIIHNKANRGNTPNQSISFTKKIVLKHDQSTFSFDFSTLRYIAPKITEYAYCMEGLNEEWVYLKGGHTAYYTKVPPGRYTFKVKAANASGIWNEEPTCLAIVILPPWWLSSIAKGVYALFFVGGCFFIGYLVSHRNKKRMQWRMKLFEDEKEKELYQSKIDFFIHIAHEIRTPLTLIKSPLDKVLNNKEIPQKALGYLSVVDKNANRLLALVNQLLDFRKTEIKGYRLNFVETNIVQLVYDMYEQFKDAAEQQGLEVNITSDSTLLYAFVDQEACTKVVSNLFSNALKYARSFILVHLFFSEDRTHFLIDVSNDGEPIAEDIQKKVFEPFFRGASSMHKPGTGLGLPFAKSLAEMHQGTLVIEESSDSLVTFRLSLPLSQPNSIRLDEEAKALPPDPAHAYETDRSRPTVLVVEDNHEMQRFVAHEINAMYNVLTASNGEEALVLLRAYSVQLLVSDVMMPVMDGFTLLKKVKNNLEFSHIPVVVLTAKSTMQSRLEGLELGADAYVEKPFTMDLLLAQITNLLNNRNSMKLHYLNSPIAGITSIAYTKADEAFLEKLNEIINEHIADLDLDVDMIADLMHLSRPTFYRKIKGLSNLTPNELINVSRLKKAAYLMLEGKMKVYEIAEAVGFNSQSYFSRAFAKQFNMSPSQYVKANSVPFV